MKNNLKKTSDSSEVIGLLETSVQKYKKIIAWRFIGSEKVTAELTIKQFNKFRSEIQLSVDDDFETLKSLLLTSRVVNFFLPENYILFQAEFNSFHDPSELRIKLPSTIAYIDQRKSPRLILDDFDVYDLIIKKQVDSLTPQFRKRCFDISLSGFSFLVTKSELKLFNRDDKFNVVINGEKIRDELEAIMKSCTELKPTEKNGLSYAAYKIGMEFYNLAPRTKNMVEDFLFVKMMNVEDFEE